MIRFPRLKRNQRIIRNLIIVIAIVIIWLIVVDFASFTPKAAFRRLEKSHLSGPGDILTITENPGSSDSKVVLSTYQDYIQVGTIHKNYFMWKGHNLDSYKSHGDVTVVPYNKFDFQNALIYAVTNIKDAARAEMTIEFQYTGSKDEVITTVFTYEGLEEAEGLYYFLIDDQYDESKYWWERDKNIEHLISQIGQIAEKRSRTNYSYPIQLRLFSESGELLINENLELNHDYLFGN